MINNWKLGIKSIRYAYGIKMNAAMAILFTGLSIVCYCLGIEADVGIFGDYILMCVGLLPAQLIASLNASNMVTASPVGKKMQTSVPAAVTCCNMAAAYLIITAVRVIMICRHPELLPGMGGELIRAAIIMALIMAYLGVAYKFFYLSMIFVFVLVMALSPHLRSGQIVFGIHLPWPRDGRGMAAAVLAGLGIIAAGGFLQYLISRLCYRYPLSKMAQSAPLRREL